MAMLTSVRRPFQAYEWDSLTGYSAVTAVYRGLLHLLDCGLARFFVAAGGLRWQSAAATPLSERGLGSESGVALRFPPQSKARRTCLSPS